jgi:hypothetical protein
MRNVASAAELTKAFFAEIDKSRLTPFPSMREVLLYFSDFATNQESVSLSCVWAVAQGVNSQ